jgi:hypothetical protein
MNMLRPYFALLLAGCLVVTVTACDQSEQNFEIEEGDRLEVLGPAGVEIPNYDSSATATYTVRAFTVNQEYSWSVEGTEEGSVQNEGEEYVVDSPDQLGESYTVSVTSTVDGQEVSGSQSSTVASYPTLRDQAGRYGKSIFATVAGNTGIITPLVTRGTAPDGYTVFVPTNEAFLNALDANDDGEISDAETPETGVLTQILQYHVASDSLTAGDLSSGSVPTVLNEDEVLDVQVGSNVTVNGATVTQPDIALTEGVGHVIDQVLLPNAIASFDDQELVRNRSANVDSVTVQGAYLPDGGFVVLHDSTELADGDAVGSVRGVSEYLDAGFHASIPVATDDTLSAAPGETVPLTAMPHTDDGDETYEFPAADGPYTRTGSNGAVVNSATIEIPE